MARTNEGELARLAADGVAPDTPLRVPHMFSYAIPILAESKSLPNGLRAAA